ncbi:MAG: glycerophosphodiester phosphodiesterase [Ruminococcaceae bacterium]|nr:glycerophosphodiester phosphodiesterase [Oscillospiraceae bacterium]
MVVILILLLLVALYVAMIMPRPTARPDMAPLLCNYAHRGLFDNKRLPENSMGAFARAVDKGIGIELDLRLTKDGEVVVFHDATLARMCGKDLPLSSLTYEELQKERLMGTEYGIPRFAEVLKLVDGKVPLLVELKGENAEDALCWRVAPLLDAYGGEYSVESFNPLLLRWFSKHRPDVARGQLVTNLLREKQEGSKILNFALTHMLLNFLSRPDFIACDGRYQRDLAFWICKKIFRVPFFMWTVRKQELLDYNRRTGRFSIFEGFLPK